MNFLKIAGEDIKSIFKNRFIRVSIIAIIVVPLLYSLLYLYAFWDPYAKLEDVHIAVVNKDEGTILDGAKVNYGKDVEDELKNNKEIGWKITSEEDANKGLEGKEYYAKVVIPEDFSSNVISAKEGAPQVAKVDFISNDKKNFLASQINSKVEAELKAKITKKISSNYVEVAFDSLYEAKDGLTKAADGSKQIYDGLRTMNEKVPTLVDGANKLGDGSSQLLGGQVALNDGIGTLIGGAKALNSGLGQVYEKVPTLSDGVNALAKGTGDLKSGISEASSGANQLSDGSKNIYNAYTGKIYPAVGQLKAGANELNSGLSAGQEDIAKLYEGANRVTAGSDPLVAGYSKIETGINELINGVSDSVNATTMIQQALENAASPSTSEEDKNKSIQQALQIINKIQSNSKENAPKIQRLAERSKSFEKSLNDYSQGSKNLASGTTSLISKVGTVKDGISQLNAGLNGLYANLDPKTSEFGVGLKAISDNMGNLNVGLNKLNVGASQLNDGTSALKSNIPTLASGITALYDGSNELANGSVKLADGSNQLVSGQKALNDGISQLTASVPELSDGVKKLYDGSNELTTKLNEGSDKMKDGLVNPSNTMGEFASEPINMAFDSINKIPNYGTGFAPYFIPLSLWIGAIMMFFVIPSKVKDEENLSKFDRVVGKYLSYAFVGVLQAILVSVVVIMLGLEASNVFAYIGTNIFLSLVFVSIIQCLISLLGDAGRLLGIILLILQLTACAGTFPLEVVPKFFRVINPFMPFTYAVEALREVISADVINYSVIGKDFLILGLILVVFLTISVALKNVGEKIAGKIEGRKSEVTA
ncbi:YhgE/Pip domain-containing protein [Clostridium tertium]|uniref:YhgE/Pip domain-containing protein n=1 Tax=Clostridium tertium TaxID=1559 RepID=UPI00232CC7A1|nr:YhgE/Pip domain-containing protein [Clostridium tertium]MDB1940064.1 YhgE/Pip domain-containing protein [Clostridium tertium]